MAFCMSSVYLTASTGGKSCADPPSCVRLCARVQSSFAGELCPWSAGHLNCKLLSVLDTVTCDLFTPDPRQFGAPAMELTLYAGS